MHVHKKCLVASQNIFNFILNCLLLIFGLLGEDRAIALKVLYASTLKAVE